MTCKIENKNNYFLSLILVFYIFHNLKLSKLAILFKKKSS